MTDIITIKCARKPAVRVNIAKRAAMLMNRDTKAIATYISTQERLAGFARKPASERAAYFAARVAAV
jgi:hypothetical protein